MSRPDLIEHPEGGRYREIFRSITRVRTEGGDTRSALTHIYFSLAPGEVSRFHRIRSDEVWNLYEGPGLLLLLWDGHSATVQTLELSRRTGGYCQVVPANTWQAARPLSEAVLVGCSVAPGFEFEDFELLTLGSTLAADLVGHHPDLRQFLGSDAWRSIGCPHATALLDNALPGPVRIAVFLSSGTDSRSPPSAAA